MTQPEREQRVSAAFVALADTLVDDYDIIDLLDQLVAHCVALLAADAAGIMLADPREQLRPVAASSEDAETMELLQLQSDEGPCLEAYRTATQVRIAELSQVADRWPRFVAAVARSGSFASVHAIPLRLRGQAIGALNLFHREPGALPDADLALGQALADVATISICRWSTRWEGTIDQLYSAVFTVAARGMAPARGWSDDLGATAGPGGGGPPWSCCSRCRTCTGWRWTTSSRHRRRAILGCGSGPAASRAGP